MSVRLCDPATMRDDAWPADSAKLRAYTQAFTALGSARLIRNLRTRVMVLCAGEVALPVTINDAEYDNAYVCSPYTAYALYSKEEMRLLESRLLRRALESVADALGSVLKAARINRMVQVNNWMLSTNLFPKKGLLPVAAIAKALAEALPEHYICFRSLNGWDGGDLREAFVAAGYQLVASRQVYVYERLAETWGTRSNAKHDRRLLRHSPYELVQHNEFVENDYARMAELYDMLYMRKYSRYNPAFTAEFMRLCHRSRAMHFFGLRGSDGALDGVLGLFTIDGTTTAPVVGYDTERERRLGLYRLLMTLVFEHALEQGYDVNLSSGAAGFKRLRGGRPYIEYSAIFDRHLPLRRRLALSALAAPVNSIGIPMMQRLQL